jgi:peptidylprolyl isomerase domain and WD repeat-containing protein 1
MADATTSTIDITKRGRENGHGDDEDNPKRTRSDNTPGDSTSAAATQPAALAELPQTSHYHVSYMHRQVITHVVSSLKHGYVLTASMDGVVKFWKRMSVASTTTTTTSTSNSSTIGGDSGLIAATAASSSKCLEFVKSFIAHVGPVVALVMSSHEDMAASIGLEDGILKLYDISTFDVTAMLRLDTSTMKLGPSAIFWADSFLAVTARETGLIYILDVNQTTAQQESEDLPADESQDEEGNEQQSYSLIRHTIKLHAAPVTAMTYNLEKQCVLSADSKGILELWDCSGAASRDDPTHVGSPCTAFKHGITFTSKMDTDLYHLLRKKTYAIALATTPSALNNAKSQSSSDYYYAMYCADHKIRFMEHATARILVTMDESAKMYDTTFSNPIYQMDIIDYGRRAATEREIQQTTTIFTSQTSHESSSSLQRLAIVFDPTGQYILIPTMVGIKIVDWQRRHLLAIVGQADASQLRFLTPCLCWGDAKVNRQMQLARTGGSSAAVTAEQSKPSSDALILALGYQQRRVYVFSHVDPCEETSDTANSANTDDRDVWNEPPDAQEQLGGAMWAGMNRQNQGTNESSKLGKEAILRTTLGDIHIKLFPEQVPKTIENFCGHARAGYYDNVIFHR